MKDTFNQQRHEKLVFINKYLPRTQIMTKHRAGVVDTYAYIGNWPGTASNLWIEIVW